jgi:hypothetical protein
MNNSKKENDSGLVNFDKKRFGVTEKNKVKTLERLNGRGAQNTDKEFKKNMGEKKKFSKEMKGIKSSKSKSSWKGAGKLGSTRKAWRPDRAYDFGRNHMEINDVTANVSIWQLWVINDEADIINGDDVAVNYKRTVKRNNSSKFVR